MLFEDVAKNKIKTLLIFAVMVAITFTIVYFLLFIELQDQQSSIIIAIVISIVLISTIYFSSDKLILGLTKARPATTEEHLELKEILESLCLGFNLPVPKLYIVDDININAFSSGRSPKNSIVCVTTGLLKHLDKYQIEAVIAHELSHIKNYDTLLQSITIALIGLVAGMGESATRELNSNSTTSRNKNIIGLLIVIVASTIFAFFLTIIRFIITRKREYLADANAVAVCRNPNAMIDALNIIQAKTVRPVVTTCQVEDYQPDKRKELRSLEAIYIVSPISNDSFFSIWSTHPSLEDRIKRLEHIQ